MPDLTISDERATVQFDSAGRPQARLLLCFALMRIKLFLREVIRKCFAAGRRFAFRYTVGVLRFGAKSLQDSRIGAR